MLSGLTARLSCGAYNTSSPAFRAVLPADVKYQEQHTQSPRASTTANMQGVVWLHAAVMRPRQQLWHGFGNDMRPSAKQQFPVVPGMAKVCLAHVVGRHQYINEQNATLPVATSLRQYTCAQGLLRSNKKRSANCLFSRGHLLLLVSGHFAFQVQEAPSFQ